MEDTKEPLLIRIGDYLLSVDILGENSDGTLAVEYNVITKDPEQKVDHTFIEQQLPVVINKILEEYIEKHEGV
jgi:hypothetical protein